MTQLHDADVKGGHRGARDHELVESEVQPKPLVLAPAADPGPLGLAAFAVTTFLLSAKNAGWTDGSGDAWLGFALAYGGGTQLLAGMWEFRNRNVFGATAFSSYGGFWIGLGLYVLLAAPKAKNVTQEQNDLGWILLAFTIFTAYMLLWSSQVNTAVFLVFFVLEVTFIVLTLGEFSSNTSTLKLGGMLGVLTAACAWYASAAGVINNMTTRTVLPVGKPMGIAQ